jgi:iron complex outermembrane receptor protein
MNASTLHPSIGFRLLRTCLRSGLVTAGLVAWLLASSVSVGQDAVTPSSQNLADLSLEELMDVEVTSVSKKETKLNDSPAAISVITQDDIRRLGITTLPGALRLVPGLDVARIDGSQWAISSRGFNGQYANKLLVLVDGRSVYTPSFGGVYWNAQDTMLEDLDRIEVIRGPGATLWGDNAVNGVINIISKNSKDTQGILASTSFGTEDQPSVSIRYGGQIAPDLTYRAYIKYFNREGLVDSQGDNTPDEWNSIRAGFRTDWQPSLSDLVTFQGDYYSINTRESVNVPSLTPPFAQAVDVDDLSRGANVLGRWTRNFSDASHLSLQTYFDYFKHEQNLTVETRKTADIQLEYRFPLLGWNDVLWGLEYRFSADEFNRSSIITWTPDGRDLHLFTGFLQDEVNLIPNRLRLTVGSKLEHNDYTGFEIQPSGRLLWTPATNQTIWASVSRAISTPDRVEIGSQVNNIPFQPSPFAPVVQPVLLGNQNLLSEKLIAYELGYRIEPTRNLSFDAATFYNFYDDIHSPVAGAPVFEPNPAPGHVVIPLTWQNAITGQGYGTELSVQWKPIEDWRLIASYSWLQMHLSPENTLQKASPEHQLSLRSYVTLPWKLEFNTAAYFVDHVEVPAGNGTVVIPSYVRVDAGLVWHPNKSLEVGLWGQNLLDNRHPEFFGYYSPIQTEIPRGVLGKITWRY